MNVTLRADKITLSVNNQEVTFSEEELVSILKEHFKKEGPKEGIWFLVDPLSIDQDLFKDKRVEKEQEEVRLLILEAFEELKNNPERYSKPFRTLIPSKTRDKKDFVELIELVSDFGDHIANWVEQALEWAQRIANGETWEKLCNKPDTSKWFRVIEWKDGKNRMVGNAIKAYKNSKYPSTHICGYEGFDMYDSLYSVPLIVDYESSCKK